MSILFCMDLPIGLHVTKTAKTLSRAFDDALVAAGGAAPTWLGVVAVKTNQGGAARGRGGVGANVAGGVGVEGKPGVDPASARRSPRHPPADPRAPPQLTRSIGSHRAACPSRRPPRSTALAHDRGRGPVPAVAGRSNEVRPPPTPRTRR